MTAQSAVSLLVALGVGGLLVEGLRAVVQRRRMNADVAHSHAEAKAIEVATALSLLDPMRRQIADLQAQLDQAERRAEELAAQLVQVTHELHQARVELDALREEQQRAGRWDPR